MPIENGQKFLRSIDMKRLFNLLFGVLICFSILGTVCPAKSFADNDHRGEMYTDNSNLSDKLDAIFDGTLNLFYDNGCTNEVRAALGTHSVREGTTLYVGSPNGIALNSGETCWIYANAVYYTLFNEAIGDGVPGKNSISLNISNTRTKKMSFANFQEWGVRNDVGALVRISTDDWAHSFVVLGYNSESVAILDGNGDGDGLVAITNLKWKDAGETYNFKGDIMYIVQPKDDYYNDLYPGYLSKCTRYSCTGEIEITKKTNLKLLPCSMKTCNKSTTLKPCKPGKTFCVCGLYENTVGNYWYQVKADDATYGYIFAGDAKFAENAIGHVFADSFYSLTGSDLWVIDKIGKATLIHS